MVLIVHLMIRLVLVSCQIADIWRKFLIFLSAEGTLSVYYWSRLYSYLVTSIDLSLSLFPPPGGGPGFGTMYLIVIIILALEYDFLLKLPVFICHSHVRLNLVFVNTVLCSIIVLEDGVFLCPATLLFT